MTESTLCMQPQAAAQTTARTLVMLNSRSASLPMGHDRQSRVNVARRLAGVMGFGFGGEYDADVRYQGSLYFVPHDALVAADAAVLGIRGPHHLFGGVVPHAFVATKAITHPLISCDAAAPEGWSTDFVDRAKHSVLRGFTTFCPRDTRKAATVLLRDGPVRIKCVSGIGGARQHLVASETAIDEALGNIDSGEFKGLGVAVEEHLDGGVTYSVGHVQCGGDTIAYCGTQQTTRNGRGHEVYGGSVLDVVRGGFDALLESDMPAQPRLAVELARTYDAAAFAAYPGAFASRRNYDVLFGTDAAGHARAGVLEQSWRIGGASAAEVVALAAFKRSRVPANVRCATVEIYDDECRVPDGAFVYYRGVDAHVGPLTKYAVELGEQDA